MVGIGPSAWSELVSNAAPKGCARRRPRPPNLFLHIRSERRDLDFELARRCVAAFEGALEVREETPGFRYLDSRDLTDFVDGTENPEGEERAEVALVGAEDPAVAGGSYILLRRYVHDDVARWATAGKSEQEGIIGRTKDTDQELDDEIKPETARIGRVVIEEDGEELEILHHSLPYGDSREAGPAFVAYSRQRSIFDLMLGRMFLADTEGHYDHLMDCTRAVSGAFNVAPSLDRLESLTT